MQSARATGHDALHKFGRRAKGRRNLARIEHADATAAARADIKQSPVTSQRSGHYFDRLRKIDVDDAVVLRRELGQGSLVIRIVSQGVARRRGAHSR